MIWGSEFMQKINVIMLLSGIPPKCQNIHFTEERMRPNAYEATTPGLNIRFLRFSGTHKLDSCLHALSQVIQDCGWKWIAVEGKHCIFDFDEFSQALVEHPGKTPEIQRAEWMKGKVVIEPSLDYEPDKYNKLKQNTILELTITEADVSKNPYSHLKIEFAFTDIAPGLILLECDEELKQGTGFILENRGLVTCAHVLGTHTKAIHPQTEKKYNVKIIAQEPALDLALLQFTDPDDPSDFKPYQETSADGLEVGAPVVVSGFPNYRQGDTGVFKEGKIVGFRSVSGVRRMLIDASIVAGNSGGPVFNHKGQVIGVAVTGADRTEEVDETENHAVIPIDTIRFLSGSP